MASAESGTPVGQWSWIDIVVWSDSAAASWGTGSSSEQPLSKAQPSRSATAWRTRDPINAHYDGPALEGTGSCLPSART